MRRYCGPRGWERSAKMSVCEEEGWGEITHGDLGLDFSFVLAEHDQIRNLFSSKHMNRNKTCACVPSRHRTMQRRSHRSCLASSGPCQTW